MINLFQKKKSITVILPGNAPISIVLENSMLNVPTLQALFIIYNSTRQYNLITGMHYKYNIEFIDKTKNVTDLTWNEVHNLNPQEILSMTLTALTTSNAGQSILENIQEKGNKVPTPTKKSGQRWINPAMDFILSILSGLEKYNVPKEEVNALLKTLGNIIGTLKALSPAKNTDGTLVPNKPLLSILNDLHEKIYHYYACKDMDPNFPVLVYQKQRAISSRDASNGPQQPNIDTNPSGFPASASSATVADISNQPGGTFYNDNNSASSILAT